ncbi:MAG: hypothetical protein U0935_16460 [Pirellulales bacterium]
MSVNVTVSVKNRHRFHLELRDQPNLDGVPLASKDVTLDLGETIDEAITNGFMGGYLPCSARDIVASVEPHFGTSPVVERIEVVLSSQDTDEVDAVKLPFTSGSWSRWSQRKVCELRDEGTLTQEQTVYQMLLAFPERREVPIPLAPLRAPELRAATLDDCGVLRLLDGDLTPDRPLLISRRFEEEAIEQCARSKEVEIGAAVLGRCVRLPAPLPGTRTPIVTLFSTLLFDPRHSGDENQFHFHPAALAESQRMCDLRGMDESIITVFHTHGWGCGDCNQKTVCPIAEAKPSLQDYQLLASLFPGKSTLLPIAGRKIGDESRRPVLQVYAWRSGQMRPIRWQRYED